jgi:carbon-monoxide dehydrogenase large subunit
MSDAQDSSGTGIGAAITRSEDRRFLTGRGTYTDDINLHGQAHAVFVRSPHAHARILGIDSIACASAPGFLAVFTETDLAADEVGDLPCGWVVTGKNGEPHNAPAHPVLARDKVRYVGDPVAMVIAETPTAALDAAENLTIDYEILDSVAFRSSQQSLL